MKSTPHQNPNSNLDIRVDSRVSLMLAVPCYHAEVSCNFLFSMLAEIPKLAQAGIEVKLQFQIGDAVNRQRNNLAGEFLKSGCTHLLFIDSDTGWYAEDILRMLAADKPVFVVNYPQRTYVWENANGETIEDFRNSILKGTTALLPASEPLNGEPFEVSYGGTGIMLIQRAVLERIVERRLVARLAGGRHRFFEFRVVEVSPGVFEDQGEDYTFCDFVRQAGFTIWCDPRARATHQGLHTWEGAPVFLPAAVPLTQYSTNPPTQEVTNG